MEQCIVLNDIALFSHRTPAMKALNATGQQNINFDTLFQVFLLNSVQHVDFHFRFFQNRSVVTLSVIQKLCKEGMVERMCCTATFGVFKADFYFIC